MGASVCRSVRDTRQKLAEIQGDTLESIADQLLDLEDDCGALGDKIEKLTTVLQTLTMAALESARVPLARIKDEDYIYDELGSQLGSATIDALRLLRGEQ